MPSPTHAQQSGLNLHEDKRIKQPVRAASTANINLSAPGVTIDGVTMVAGDRFGAFGQTTASQGGLYVWNGSAVAATRASDASVATDFVLGFLVYVSEGSTNGGKTWQYTTSTTPVVVGTTAITFVQMGAGSGGTFAGEVAGTDFSASGLTGSVAASRYVGATTTGAPTTGAHLVGDFVVDQTGKMWVCTTAGTPGTWTQTATVAASYSASGLTGSVAASRYVGATASGAPSTGAHLLGDFVVDQTGKFWICTTAGTPGTWAPLGAVQSASAAAVATGGTITTSGVTAARVSPTGAVTGVILQAGTFGGQQVTVVNEAVAANTVTFAASGTSKVADGTSSVIPGLRASTFTWSTGVSLWFRSA